MDTRPIKIYSKKSTPRLNYIAGIVLGDILGLTWEVITDKRKLGKHIVINYSDEEIIGSFKICPDTLLFEKGTEPREIIVNEWKGLPVFFPASQDSDLPFDLFAASFFLVSRYEEYLVFQPDEHGRFQASSSLAYKNGFLGIPVVDLWARELRRALLNRFNNLAFKRNTYKALLTCDADQPFAYMGKGLLRSIGGLFRDIKNSPGNANERYRTMAKGEKDPYEVFDYMIETIEKYNVDARFFFPVGDYSDYDKNPSWRNDEYRKLIRKIASKYKSGLHPSYNAAKSSSLINTETARLKTILKEDIIISRFHYIRMSMPQSYRDIMKTGICEDYSMGYPDEPGFRAGIARPYHFFDIGLNQKTNLRIIPYQVMDVTLYDYKNLGPDDASEVILKMINATRKVGGLFVSIWHNTSLLESKEWQEWRRVFEFMLKTQAS